MKNKKTHYLLESIHEVDFLFSTPEASNRLIAILRAAKSRGDLWCKVVLSKKDLNTNPTIKSVDTRKTLNGGEKDYIMIDRFLDNC